jgi:Plavaka transposase
LLDRCGWKKRPRRLPLRFRDDLPQPPLPLPPLAFAQAELRTAEPDLPAANTSATATLRALGSQIRKVFTTQKNKFGIFRKFLAKESPLHDPEEDNTLRDLSDIPEQSAFSSPNDWFYPYPNASAFHLSDWYWNDGMQKSQTSFKNLVDIIADPEFSPAEVHSVKWAQLNEKLAVEDAEEFIDADAGWVHTLVTILVPFHPWHGVLLGDHGPREYIVTDFYHRSLTSVIQEKLSNKSTYRHFHYKPYELYWQPGLNLQSPTQRVHGELYTSPAFIEVHDKLQSSLPEPDCNLPCVIIALMFWSDTMHLTSFSNAKVCPLYLFFGNESKYWRCKPSCHPCEHVAYFQKASSIVSPVPCF